MHDLGSIVLSYPVFTPKPSTHRMHDPGSIVPHIRPKGFTDNQMSRIKYDYYYINSVSKEIAYSNKMVKGHLPWSPTGCCSKS
jgi:hypothetical protein